MKTISKIKYIIILAVIAIFVSCEGPMGPAGPAGADGKDGVDGTNGVDGQDGNANVIASDWISPTWSTHPTYGSFQVNDDSITSDLTNTGAILSYIDFNGTGVSIYALPTSFHSTSAGTVFYTFQIQHLSGYNYGSIIWWYSAENNYTPPSGIKLRYILIPSSNSSGNKSANPQQEILYNLDKAGVDVNNYYDVCAYYGIQP